MPFKRLHKSISQLCSGQKGATTPLTLLFPLGILTIGLIVIHAVFGSAWFSSDQDSANASSNPATYQAGPGTFSPITDLEKTNVQSHGRVYSTVKGAIADLNNSNTDNMSLNGLSNKK